MEIWQNRSSLFRCSVKEQCIFGCELDVSTVTVPRACLEYVFQRNPCTRYLLFFLLFDTTVKNLIPPGVVPFTATIWGWIWSPPLVDIILLPRVRLLSNMKTSAQRFQVELESPRMRNWWLHPFNSWHNVEGNKLQSRSIRKDKWHFSRD